MLCGTMVRHATLFFCFYNMFTAFSVLFANAHRWFVVLMTIISLVLGMFWYGPFLFGKLYQQWMWLTKSNMKPDMTLPLIGETISKILYFVGIGMVLGNGWGMGAAIVIWFCFVFASILSIFMWTPNTVDKRVIGLTAGKVLVDTIIAVFIYGALVH